MSSVIIFTSSFYESKKLKIKKTHHLYKIFMFITHAHTHTKISILHAFHFQHLLVCVCQFLLINNTQTSYHISIKLDTKNIFIFIQQFIPEQRIGRKEEKKKKLTKIEHKSINHPTKCECIALQNLLCFSLLLLLLFIRN